MQQTLSELFRASKGQPVTMQKVLVYPIFEIKIDELEKHFTVYRLSATSSSSVQGLRLKVVRGQIVVNGESHSEIILWADTSPDTVKISITSKSGCKLKLWNVWKVNNIVQAWIGNAGFVVDNHSSSITLKCSDGIGDVDFSDLVVRIES